MSNHNIVMKNVESEERSKRDYHFRILLVEDSAIVALATSRMLAAYGYAVDIAETGEAGVEKFQNNSYDIILMDIQLPGIDGLTALYKIRELEKLHDKPRIPIVAVTAGSDRTDDEMKAFDHIFLKPFLGKMADILYEKWLAVDVFEA